jgi:hypothetical protein
VEKSNELPKFTFVKVRKSHGISRCFLEVLLSLKSCEERLGDFGIILFSIRILERTESSVMLGR